jgi:calcium-dependent protein kinase
MYILLTGEPPFNGRNDEEILKNVKSMNINFHSYLLSDVSFDAKDLLKKLLQRDVKLRISAANALEHPWIKNQAPNAKMNKNAAMRVFNNLKNFSADEKLQEAAVAFIVNQLTSKEEIEELRKIFIDLDKNNDGVLSREEIQNGLRKFYGSEQAIEETNKIFNKVDADGNGTISYDEFIRASIDKNKLISEEKLKAAYRLFDKNGDGNIEAKEIKEVLGGVGVKDEGVWDQIIKEVDENGDGVISYEEFKKMMYQLCNK